MKKSERIEKKIYECLGVNLFRKYILFNWEKVLKFLNFNISYRVNGLDYESIKKYKDNMMTFAIAHIITIILLSPALLALLNIPLLVLNFVLNGYCIMTQRYNTIRVNEVLRRVEPQYQKQKEYIKSELKKEDRNIPEHTYTYKYKNIKEDNVNIDSLIENSSLEQLKSYSKFLKDFQKQQNVWNKNTYTRRISTNKVLTIKIKDN